MLLQFFSISSTLEIFESQLTVSLNDNMKSIKSNSINKSWGTEVFIKTSSRNGRGNSKAGEGTSLGSLVLEKYKQ